MAKNRVGIRVTHSCCLCILILYILLHDLIALLQQLLEAHLMAKLSGTMASSVPHTVGQTQKLCRRLHGV